MTRGRTDHLATVDAAARIARLRSANFPNEKNRVQNQSRNYNREKDDAENEQRDLLQIQQNPADVERDGKRDQTNAQREKENYGFSATDHTHILKGKIKKAKIVIHSL